MAAPANIIVAWPSTNGSIPSGWSRVTTIDDRYVKAGASAGTTGGTTTHTHTASAGHTHAATHTHSLTAGSDSTSNNVSEPGSVNVEEFPLGGHSDHTLAASSSSAPTAAADTPSASSTGSNELNRYTVIWIKSAGSDDIASGSIVYWNSSTTPPNHNLCDGTGGTPDLRLYFLKGAAGGGDGGTKTAQSAHTHTYAHSHSVASHNHTGGTVGAHSFQGGLVTAATGGALSVSQRAHTHASSGSIASATGTTASDSSASDSTSHEPSWYKLHHLKKTSSSSDIPTGMIALWDGSAGSIPSGWAACDGTNGTPNLTGKYIKGANGSGELGNTGGTSPSSSHQHTLTHTHASGSDNHAGSSLALGADSAAATNIVAGGGAVIIPHTHTVTIGNASGTSTSSAPVLSPGTAEPQFFTAIFIQAMAVQITDTDNNAVNVTEAENIAVGAADAENLRVNVTETESIVSLTVAITSPTPAEVITRGDPTFTWTLSGTQVTYRIRVSTDPDGLVVIHDSGTVISGNLFYDMPAGVLQNSGTYYVWVDVTTTDTLEAISGLVQFSTDFATSVDISGLSVATIGDRCADPGDVPHFRLRWSQVTPGGGETFLQYDVLRRFYGESEWERIKIIDDVSTVHAEDFCVISERLYEYAVVWEADTAGGVLTSTPQSPPPLVTVAYSYSYLHEKDNPETYGLPLEAFDITVTPQQEMVFNRAWGRAARTAFVGEGFDRVIQLTTLPKLRREPKDQLALLQTILQRQATAGTVLCLRMGLDKTLYWVQVPSAPITMGQLQWNAQVTLQEVHFEEAV